MNLSKFLKSLIFWTLMIIIICLVLLYTPLLKWLMEKGFISSDLADTIKGYVGHLITGFTGVAMLTLAVVTASTLIVAVPFAIVGLAFMAITAYNLSKEEGLNNISNNR